MLSLELFSVHYCSADKRFDQRSLVSSWFATNLNIMSQISLEIHMRLELEQRLVQPLPSCFLLLMIIGFSKDKGRDTRRLSGNHIFERTGF